MTEPDEVLDESLRNWLVNALSRRVVPANYRTPLEQLITWAQSYRDGKALHDFLKNYPLAGTQPEPNASLLHTQAQSVRYDPADNARRLAEGQPQRRSNP